MSKNQVRRQNKNTQRKTGHLNTLNPGSKIDFKKIFKIKTYFYKRYIKNKIIKLGGNSYQER